MFRNIIALCSVLILTACSTMIKGETQEIYVDTPGAEKSYCILKNKDNHLKLWAPDTVVVVNSSEDLHIKCKATGNRERNLTIPSIPSQSFFLNAANGVVPGMIWDLNSGAIYGYPRKVSVDFVGIDPKSMPLPDYDNFARENPDLAGYEEFRPGLPALSTDRFNPLQEMKKHDFIIEAEIEAESAARESAYTPRASETLNREMNPAVFSSGNSVPVPAASPSSAASTPSPSVPPQPAPVPLIPWTNE